MSGDCAWAEVASRTTKQSTAIVSAMVTTIHHIRRRHAARGRAAAEGLLVAHIPQGYCSEVAVQAHHPLLPTILAISATLASGLTMPAQAGGQLLFYLVRRLCEKRCASVRSKRQRPERKFD